MVMADLFLGLYNGLGLLKAKVLPRKVMELAPSLGIAERAGALAEGCR